MKPSLSIPLLAALLATGQPLFSQGPSPAEDPKKDKEIKLQDDKGLENMKNDVKLDPSLPAPEKAPANPGATLPGPDSKLAEMPAALKKLSQEQLSKYTNLRDDATTFMRSVRLQEALEKLTEAEAVVGDPVSELENLKGAIFTKMRDFPKAREAFQKAESIDKDSFHPRFNLAELDFVEKKWSPARTAFTDLIKANEALKTQQIAGLDDDTKERVGRQFDATTRLMQFKIMICQIKEKMEPDAQAMLKQFKPYDDDSPAYYFGNAALAFAKEDKEAAEEWINSAKTIYRSDVNEIYIDSLVEMGWLQTLQ